MDLLVEFFAWLMAGCHSWCPNWWADIIIFTFLTKVLQFPISLWCQANSLKMVSLMPEEIRIKIDHYGDKDAIGEATAAIYRREHYHPLLSLVPLAINLLILMAFVKVIYGIGAIAGDSAFIAFTSNLHLKISDIPVREGGISWLMPLFAGAAAWLLGYSQNILNPLQHEQTRAQQLVTNGISIAISLFLGCFVAAGVGLYWATSNLFSILVQVCENFCIPPKKHVNYGVLRCAQAEWKKFESSLKKNKDSKEDRAREKADYRRFFSVANKHVVFYAEGCGYYRYFQSVIEWLLEHSNVIIHYVTNDPKDGIFEKLKSRVEVEDSGRVRAYYIGKTKIIPLMMKMDADIVVMTTPDLNSFHIKRSYVKKDVEYIYIDHGPTSVHMCYRKGAFDHFDTIMCNGPFQVAEHRATEKVYSLKPKKLIESGYPLLDTLAREARSKSEEGTSAEGVRIMIANSHQKDNVFDSCLDELLEAIAKASPDATVVIRPHPQYVRRFPARWQAIREKLTRRSSASTLNIVFGDDFDKPSTMDQSDILITDWSGIAYEFAYKTRRPTLFVNTPMKVINPEWKKLGLIPTDISFRDQVGVAVECGAAGVRALPSEATFKLDIAAATAALTDLLTHPDAFASKIDRLFAESFFNAGSAGPVVGSYILNALLSKQGS